MIPPTPVPHIALGLAMIFVLVLILPFKVRIVEENLEPFFLIMGILAVTISGLWSRKLVEEAIIAPVSISGLPIGIFQVVLIAGLFIHVFNRRVYSAIIGVLRRVGFSIFIFILVMVLGLISSIISVIVTAVILAEIISALPVDKKKKIELTVITCFSVGLGATLTPVGEPLATIAISKLRGPPYHADFLFLFRLLGIYIIPGIVALALYASYRVRGVRVDRMEIPEYEGTLRDVIVRAVRVYLFVSALILLGGGLYPLVLWYISKIPSEVLYWVNMISAILDNATLTAAEIGPELTLMQIKSALLGLLISGGMLIPGNIPNIVCAGRLKIRSREWAEIGVPLGLVIMTVVFILLTLENLLGINLVIR